VNRSKSDKILVGTLLPSIEELRVARLVSFDFFDTLVYRTSRSHYQMWKNESSAYFRRRAKAELVARVSNRVKRIPEISESNIYGRMPENWGLEFEIQLELKNLLPNPVILNLLQQVISAGGTPCIISDTHYRETDIKRFLNHLGIPEVKIFTSGEYSLTKSTGLFSQVQRDLGVPYSDWIHIGDNFQSDILSSGGLGIKSFHYPSMEKQLKDSGLMSPLGYKFLKKSNRSGNEVISRIFTNLLFSANKGDSEAVRMPEVLGSILGDLVSSAIAEEIHNMHVKRKYDLILYSSRDGWLPFLAHKKISPEDPIQYFKTSRKMLEDPNYKNYVSLIIGDSKRILLYDLGWRGSTARKISTYFPDKEWDYVYWQILGKKTRNQFELNPGIDLNRLRVWRSRDFLESVFTDPSRGYDQISADLIPIERDDQFGSEFKGPILEGAKHGIENHSSASSLQVASLVLEAFSRYPSKDLMKFAEGHSHQINEKATGQLVVATWKDLLRGSRILWPYGSRLDSGSKSIRTIFAATVFLKELAQRSRNLIGRSQRTT
jgi:FMN phosphatase YigB (HAD superfamily)